MVRTVICPWVCPVRIPFIHAISSYVMFACFHWWLFLPAFCRSCLFLLMHDIINLPRDYRWKWSFWRNLTHWHHIGAICARKTSIKRSHRFTGCHIRYCKDKLGGFRCRSSTRMAWHWAATQTFHKLTHYSLHYASDCSLNKSIDWAHPHLKKHGQPSCKWVKILKEQVSWFIGCLQPP